VFTEEVVKIAKVRVCNLEVMTKLARIYLGSQFFRFFLTLFECARTSSLFDRSEGGIAFAAYGCLLLSKSIKSSFTLNCIDLQSFFSGNMG